MGNRMAELKDVLRRQKLQVKVRMQSQIGCLIGCLILGKIS